MASRRTLPRARPLMPPPHLPLAGVYPKYRCDVGLCSSYSPRFRCELCLVSAPRLCLGYREPEAPDGNRKLCDSRWHGGFRLSLWIRPESTTPVQPCQAPLERSRTRSLPRQRSLLRGPGLFSSYVLHILIVNEHTVELARHAHIRDPGGRSGGAAILLADRKLSGPGFGVPEAVDDLLDVRLSAIPAAHVQARHVLADQFAFVVAERSLFGLIGVNDGSGLSAEAYPKGEGLEDSGVDSTFHA